MREGWKYCKLGEICKLYQPKTISSELLCSDGKYFVYGANGVIGRYNQYNHENAEVLMTCRGATCGTINLSKPFSWINGNAMVVHPKFEYTFYSNEFLVYLLKSIDLSCVITGCAQPQITVQSLSPLLIPVPPIEEQQRIVTELDLLSSIIEKQKAQLKELDTLAQSIFYDMFGDPIDNNKNWEIKSLGCISEKIANGYNAKLEDDTYKTEGIMYFRCQNVWRNRFDYSDLVYIDENTNKLMKSSSLKHNDLLITKIGRLYTENSSLGRVSLYEGEDDEANLSGNLCFIRLKKTICPKFILYILISEQFRGYIRRTTVGGIDKRALSTKQIEQFPIILPPLSLQQQFADKIQSIESQKSAITKSIAETQKLFDYTMDKYFG